MTFTSSINTGLQQTPDLTDIQSTGKLSFQFISLYNAIQVLQQAIDNYTGNSPQTGTSNTQTAESTVIVGNTSNFWCNAKTALSAGFLVTLTNVSGVTNAGLANASASSTLAMGLTMTAAAINTPVQILLLGLFNFGGSVTPGALYYLSDTTAGALVTTPNSTTGHIVQPVGFGVDTNSIWFNPSLNPTVN